MTNPNPVTNLQASSLNGGPAVDSINNPVLRGFNPDPSIVRVGEDYFVATSTFEWFPGVQVHHSRDLVNWRLLTHPLTRTSQLDLTGVPDSGGVWAPCLTWFDGVFYLAYSIVYELNSRMKDIRNFLITADDIEGPWSDPIEVNGCGFDPSLFHARDGRKWWLNMVWDHRPGPSQFYGIALQELCLNQQKLIGEPRIIYRGSGLGCTEGPHLYERDGWFYLVVAEGGTSWDHAVTVARARHLEGPYETSPHGPLLSSRGTPPETLQKAGHGDLVEAADGSWYLAHLASRPVGPSRRCLMGRETCLQRIDWRDDGWPGLSGGGRAPFDRVPGPACPKRPWPVDPQRIDFRTERLDPCFQTPRTPIGPERLSLLERPGVLRLRGGQSLASRHEQSIVARRLVSDRCVFQTAIDFSPDSFQQMAGLVAYYGTRLWHYACISHDETHGRCLYLQSCDEGEISFPLASGVAPLPPEGVVHLRAEFEGTFLRFFHSLDEQNWRPLGDILDAGILSDDHGGDWGFTGCFVGMACQDLTGGLAPADFHYFEMAVQDRPATG